MSKQSNSTGIGLVGLLGIAFVILKLCGVISWSWWWVALPFWGVIPVVLLVLLVAVIVVAFKGIRRR